MTVGRRHWDVDQRGRPPKEIELRAFGGGRFPGRFMVDATPGTRPTLQARLTAVTLADQAGAALDTASPGRPQ